MQDLTHHHLQVIFLTLCLPFSLVKLFTNQGFFFKFSSSDFPSFLPTFPFLVFLFDCYNICTGAFTKIEEVTNEEPYDPGRSLTPPPPPSSSLGGDENPIIKEEPKEPEKKVDEDEPYDPEENDILNIPSTSTSSIRMESHQKISQLLEQISKTANPLEMKETLLDSITKEASDDDQKLLTEAFNKKVEDFKKQLEEEERKATEAAFTIASKTIENENKNIDSIPGLDGSYPTTE